MSALEQKLAVLRNGEQALTVTGTEQVQFKDICNSRPHRNELRILIVEDQIFSQRLLQEILYAARLPHSDTAPLIDTVQGIREGWQVYLKKAPDIVFLDIGLIDGNGHSLARSIKALDPTSYVIIVTANNYEDESSVARESNVDDFVGKPYSKKQILDCVRRFADARAAAADGQIDGSSH